MRSRKEVEEVVALRFTKIWCVEEVGSKSPRLRLGLGIGVIFQDQVSSSFKGKPFVLLPAVFHPWIFSAHKVAKT